MRTNKELFKDIQYILMWYSGKELLKIAALANVHLDTLYRWKRHEVTKPDGYVLQQVANVLEYELTNRRIRKYFLIDTSEGLN